MIEVLEYVMSWEGTKEGQMSSGVHVGTGCDARTFALVAASLAQGRREREHACKKYCGERTKWAGEKGPGTILKS